MFGGTLGYILQTPYWSKGIMTEAVRQLCEEAFSTPDILRITALVCAPNLASCRVLEKNGFVLEGMQPRKVVKGDCVYDRFLYGLLK